MSLHYPGIGICSPWQLGHFDDEAGAKASDLEIVFAEMVMGRQLSDIFVDLSKKPASLSFSPTW